MADLAVDAGHPFCAPESITVFLFMRQEKGESIELTNVLSLTDLYIIFFRHSRVNGNPVFFLDSRSPLTTCGDKLRGNDGMYPYL